MKNDRRQTDPFIERLEAVEYSCNAMGKCIESNQKILEEQGKIQFGIVEKLDELNNSTAAVVKAYEDGKTWMRVSKWGAGVFALFSGAIYGFLKIKGGS